MIWCFRQEMERQRLAEWEKQRKAELMQHRQREQEKVLILKARHDHINADLEKVASLIEIKKKRGPVSTTYLKISARQSEVVDRWNQRNSFWGHRGQKLHRRDAVKQRHENAGFIRFCWLLERLSWFMVCLLALLGHDKLKKQAERSKCSSHSSHSRKGKA